MPKILFRYICFQIFCVFILAVQKMSKNLHRTHNSRHQRGVVKRVLYWRLSDIRHRSAKIYLSGLSGDQVLCIIAFNHFFVLLYMYKLHLHCSVMDPKYRVVFSSFIILLVIPIHTNVQQRTKNCPSDHICVNYQRYATLLAFSSRTATAQIDTVCSTKRMFLCNWNTGTG